MSIAPNLFSIPRPPAHAPHSPMVGTGIPLRWCQLEDCNALTHAIETGHNRPCCVAATGYGKGPEAAEMAGRLIANGGKVVCLIDRAHLVQQQAEEIERHLGIEVGRIADGECVGIQLPVVVATVQAMYTPDREGRPLYTYPQFESTRGVIVDEGHKFFAPCFRSVADHFVEMNDAVVIGFTATPVAANGEEWVKFFNWTPGAEGPCMRTVPWCVRNGLLAPLRQAYVHVDLRLDEIYARLADTVDSSEADDEDAPDAGVILYELLKDKGEQEAAKFAKGVADVIGERRTLVFSPPRVAAAQLLASWLKKLIPCDAVWGARVDKSDVLARFKRGRPQALTNVNLLCEGFNDPTISAIFICRLMQNWRMVQQMVGRALRPHPSVMDRLNELDGPDKSEARRQVIAASVKPDALVADLVGIDEKVMRASAVDVMFPDTPESVRREAGEILYHKPRDRGERPEVDELLMAEAQSRLLTKQHEALAEMARHRGMAGDLPADVNVTYADGSSVELPSMPTPVERATEGEKAMFVAYATKYDLTSAVGIAERTPRNQLKGMTFGMKKRDGQPDWRRARQAYPAWAAAKQPAKPVSEPTYKATWDAMPVGTWQRERIHKLDSSAAIPKTQAEAKDLITRLENRRRDRVA